jgi:hypothetical protein
MKYFIDIVYPDRTERRGQIAFPQGDAKQIRDQIKLEHPDWIVELNPLEGTP